MLQAGGAACAQSLGKAGLSSPAATSNSAARCRRQRHTGAPGHAHREAWRGPVRNNPDTPQPVCGCTAGVYSPRLTRINHGHKGTSQQSSG